MVTSYLLRLVLYFAIFLSSSTVSQAISLKGGEDPRRSLLLYRSPICYFIFGRGVL